jgi:lipid-A-disaccharide synthase
MMNAGFNNEIMIITGEVSADLIGASLIKELKQLNTALRIVGIGGDKMKAEGTELIYHIDRMAFLGLVEVVKHLPFINEVKKKLVNVAMDRNIKHVILIDYPGFNLNIANKFDALGMKVIYYVSPQLWAWGSGRVNKVKKLIDKMLVVFPFEQEFYRKHGVDVEYVGHPLVERINQYSFLSKEELYSRFNLDKSKDILLLMPGSRKQEVKKIFPECIKAAHKLAEKYNMEVVVAGAGNIDKKIFFDLSGSYDLPAGQAGFKIISGYNYDLMKHAKFGIIKSGTSTLEAGFLALPMVIVYKTNFLTYLIGRQLVKLDSIGMVNILLDVKIVPELIQNDVKEETIFTEAEKILSDDSDYRNFKQKLSFVKNKLGEEGASKKAAKSIYKLINES